MTVSGGGELVSRTLAEAADLVADAAVRTGERWTGAAGAAAQAEAIQRRADRLGDANRASYDAAREALDGRLGGEERQQARDFLVGRAVEDAAGPPLALAEAGADLAALAAEVAEHAGERDRADAIAAGAVAAGAAQAAAALVAANLVAGSDDARAGRAWRAAERARASCAG